MKKERDSNFELLRLFAMFSIVFYHLLGVYWHIGDTESHGLLVALTSPFHVGVPVFVMISGWYGIRTSWKGVFKLLIPVFIYYVPIALYVNYTERASFEDYMHSIMFLSQTEYWFVQTYLWLFIASPAINLYIHNQTVKQRFTTLLILAFVSMYVGTFGNDTSLVEGKNVIHFALLYIVGDTLKTWKSVWDRISWKIILTIYMLVNIGLVLVYPIKPFIPMNMFFPYNSVGIIINSILILMLFSKIKLQNRFINYIAASSFVIYLIHGQPTLFKFQMDILCEIYDQIGYGLPFILTIIGCSIVVMSVSIALDKIISPVYTRLIHK